MRIAFSFHAIHFKPQVLKSFSWSLPAFPTLHAVLALWCPHSTPPHHHTCSSCARGQYHIMAHILSKVNEKSFAGGALECMNVLINIRDCFINDAHLTWVFSMAIQAFFAPAMRALGPKAKVRVV